MSITELKTTEDLEKLTDEWICLRRRCPSTTPFQSPAWLVPWWRNIGEGTLRAIAIHKDGELIGIAPFYIYTQESGSREVFLLGIGTSDYLDIIAAPEYADEVITQALAYLTDIRSQWDVCDFQQLRPNSPLVAAAPPSTWTNDLQWQEVCPVLWLDPDAGSDQPPSNLPAKMLDNVRYGQRRLAKAGEVAYESASDENLNTLFDALLELHAARWSTKGESGVLWGASVQRAHRESLPALHKAGLLRLYGLRLDGRIIAVLYGLADSWRGGRVYYYLSGFDPEFDACSPGALIISHAIMEAQNSGATAFDFLRGKEDYKYRWGAVDTFTYRRRFRQSEEAGIAHRSK